MREVRSRRITLEAEQARHPLHFIRGPLPVSWLAAAVRAGGSAPAVGLVLWYCRGLQRGAPRVRLAPARVRELGLSDDAARRGLGALEHAGLVIVERARGKAPFVTIVDREEQSRADERVERVGADGTGHAPRLVQ